MFRQQGRRPRWILVLCTPLFLCGTLFFDFPKQSTPTPSSAPSATPSSASATRAARASSVARAPLGEGEWDPAWAVQCTKKSNVTQAASVLRSRLLRYGRASADAIGPDAVLNGFRVLSAAKNFMSKFLVKLDHRGLAFYPLLVQRDKSNSTESAENEKGPLYKMRLTAEAIPLPEVPEVAIDDIFLAPAADDKITGLATAVKEKVMADGIARVAGLGGTSMNRLLKALIRANDFLAKEQDEDSSEPVYLWAVPGKPQDIGKSKDGGVLSSCFDVVKGPIPEL